MSLEEEDTSLKELVTKTLQNNGVLGKIQAQLRATVFLALEDEFKENNVPLVSPSVKQLLGTREGALAAALVQDFLQSLNLDFTLSVFAPESGHSALWSFPGKEAVKKDLKLETSRDNRCPLLLEILRERESQRLFKNEEPKKQPESLSVYISTPKKEKPLNPSFPPLNEPKQLPQLKKLPLDILEQNDNLRSGKNNNSDRTFTNSKSADEDKQNNEVSMAVIEKQYKDDFSFMSEKDGTDDEEEEEIGEDEDIDEDVSNLINLSMSPGSDHTKDQLIDLSNYQEDL